MLTLYVLDQFIRLTRLARAYSGSIYTLPQYARTAGVKVVIDYSTGIFR